MNEKTIKRKLIRNLFNWLSEKDIENLNEADIKLLMRSISKFYESYPPNKSKGHDPMEIFHKMIINSKKPSFDNLSTWSW